MRFLFGVLVGYSMRGESKLLITILATLVLFSYVICRQAHSWRSIWTYNVSAIRDQLKPEFQRSKD